MMQLVNYEHINRYSLIYMYNKKCKGDYKNDSDKKCSRI